MKILNSLVGVILSIFPPIVAGSVCFLTLFGVAVLEYGMTGRMGEQSEKFAAIAKEGLPYVHVFSFLLVSLSTAWIFPQLGLKLIDDSHFKITAILILLPYLFLNIGASYLTDMFNSHFLSWVIYIGCLAIIGRLLWVQLQERGLSEGLIMSSQNLLSKFTKSES